MKRLILTILLIIAVAYVVHWTGIPIGTYVDAALDWVFSWTNGIIPKLTELLPKLGEWVSKTLSSIKGA